MTVLIYLFWILVVLNIADVSFTTMILNRGGEEANPYVNFFIQQFGTTWGILIAKVPPFVWLWYIIYKLGNRVTANDAKYTSYALGIIILGYVYLNIYSYDGLMQLIELKA